MQNNSSRSKVVHCRKEKFDVYIGRPSKWGNPFPLIREGDRPLVLQQYVDWLSNHPELIEAAKRELKGKTLGCFCKPKLCHGDILAMIANEEL